MKFWATPVPARPVAIVPASSLLRCRAGGKGMVRPSRPGACSGAGGRGRRGRGRQGAAVPAAACSGAGRGPRGPEGRRVPKLPVAAVRAHQLRMRAALGDPAVVQDDDLVDLVESLQVVGDEQGGAARGDGEQVGGQRGARLQGRGGRSARRGSAGPGRRAGPGPGRAAAAHRRTWRRRARRPGCPSPAGSDSIQGSSRARAAAAASSSSLAPRPGQAQVVPDGGVEDVRVLGTAADHRPHLIGGVAGQVARRSG